MKKRYLFIFAIVLTILTFTFYLNYDQQGFSITGNIIVSFQNNTDLNAGTFYNTSVGGVGITANVTLNKSMYGADSVPQMTSDSVPSGTVTYSSAINSVYYGWKAFTDGAETDMWRTTDTASMPQWIAYEFTSNKTIQKYTIDAGSWYPTAWNFEGWNGTGYEILDNRSGESAWAEPETRNFTFVNNNGYDKYRLYVTAAYTTGRYMMIQEIEMMEKVYDALGNFTSQVIDAGSAAKWVNISWNGTEPSGTNLSIAFRSCDDSACSGEDYSSYYDSNEISLINNLDDNQYFQFTVNFTTTNSSLSPTLDYVNISYSEDLDPPITTFPYYTNATYKNNENTNTLTLNISLNDSTGLTGSICIINVNGTNQSVTVTNNWCNSSEISLINLNEGIYPIKIYVNDTYDNFGLNKSYYVGIDTTAPVITLPVYTNATFKKNTSALTLNISVIDASSGETNSACIFDINGTNQTVAVSNEWCNITVGNLTGLADGNQTISVYVNDTMNNLGLNNSFVVFTDTTDPLPTADCTPTNPTDNGEIVTCSCSGTDATAGINSSLTTAGTSTVTSTAGTTSYICSLTDYAGNTATSITTYTVSGGGGSGIASSTKSNLFTTLTPEKVSIMKNFNEETGVKEIQIQVKDEIQNVKITVSKFDEKPVSVSVEKTGKVHKYFQIKTENLETDLKKATVTIQVEKSWISNNSLNKDDIALFKFDNSSNNWNELTTTYKEEDDEYYYYDAELTSFSYFAISEKVVIEEEIVEEKTEEIIDGNKQEESINKGLILWWILVIVLILAILILILIIIRLIKPKRGDIDYIQPFKPIIQQPATEGEEWQQ